MMSIVYNTVNDSFLIEAINQADQEISLTAPGVSMAVAVALLEASNKLKGNVHLLVDASQEAFSIGFCDLQVIKFLRQECIIRNLHTFRSEPGIRTGVLTVDDITHFFTPEMLVMEKFQLSTINAARPYTDKDSSKSTFNATELNEIVIPDTNEPLFDFPKTKEEQLQTIIRQQQKKIIELEKNVRSLEQDKSKLPIQQNLQFVDIEVSKYRIDKFKIKIPAIFLTDAEKVNARLDSKYLVLSQDEKWNERIKVKNGAKNEFYSFNSIQRAVDELRNDYTDSLGVWGRVIEVQFKEDFKLKLNQLNNMMLKIKDAFSELLKKKINDRLEELFETLKPQIKHQYQTQNCFNTDNSESKIKDYFFIKMQHKVEHTLCSFDPQIKVVFRDISRDDAENPEFRKAVEHVFSDIFANDLFTKILRKVN